MSLRGYVVLWAIMSVAIALEYFALNQYPAYSFSHFLKMNVSYFHDLNLSPLSGRPISLLLGWTGIGFICVTNLYILRKHLRFLFKMGSLARWLDFHIFCGMIGPTFVIFHTNFKVGGLVAISFWSMVIVAVSGIVGRYFYAQVLRKRGDLERDISDVERSLAVAVPRANFEAMKTNALRFVGAHNIIANKKASLAKSLAASMWGDVRLMFTLPGIGERLPTQSRRLLKNFALAKRRLLFFENFQQYLGYWHSFHIPFAFFMYVVAVIHIASALVFGVSG